MRVGKAQLPEGDGCRGGHIQRIYPVAHGNARHLVGLFDNGMGQTVAFCSQDDGQPGLVCQCGMVNGQGVVCKCHSHRAKSLLMQVGNGGV